jgi:quercetin dioxygenase-like cupin family protein
MVRMTSDGQGVIRGPGEGQLVIWPNGTRFFFQAAAEDTGGVLSVGTSTLPPAGAASPHVHEQNEETFYVLEGEITVGLGDRTSRAPAGSFVFVPRGVVHSLRNEGSTPATLLVIITPAGMERMFEELGHVFSTGGGPPDPAAIAAVRRKYASRDETPPEEWARRFTVAPDPSNDG